MGTFIETVTIDADEAIAAKINNAGSPFKFAKTSKVATGDTVAGVTLILSRSLTEDERETLEKAIKAIGNTVELGLIKDLEIVKGFKAFRDFVGQVWEFTLQGHLRTDPVSVQPVE